MSRFNRERNDSKGKKNSGLTSLLGGKTDEKLEELCKEAKENDEKFVASMVDSKAACEGSFTNEELDAILEGNVSYGKSPEIKKSGINTCDKISPQTRKGFQWRTHFISQPISADITIACIELNYSLEQIQNYINACLKYYGTKFYKFIFFGNNIYSTKMIAKSDISKEEIFNTAKIQKELSEKSGILGKDNILLYDAIDEAFYLSKEENFFEKTEIKIEKNKYRVEKFKYLFVISGEDKGSGISKNELQKVICKARNKKENDMHVVLTDASNVTKIATLGFRSIKPF